MSKPRIPKINRAYCEHRLAHTKRAKVALGRLGRNLRLLRNERGLTLEQVGNAVGCSRQQLAHIESCENFPSWPVYHALCEFFNAGELPMA